MKKVSVKSRILWSVLLVSGGFLITIISFLLFIEQKKLSSDFENDARNASRLLAAASVACIESGVNISCNEEFQKAIFGSSLTGVYLYNSRGHLFSSYPPSPVPPQLPNNSESYLGKTFQRIENVSRRSENLGKLHTIFSTDRLRQDVRNMIQRFFILFIFGVLANLLLISMIQKAISSPLKILANEAKQITENLDFSLRASTDSQDEIGIVAAGFNKLMTKVQKREQERAQAEAALQKSEERYRTLLETIPDPVFVLQNDVVVYMNHNGVRLLGYSDPSEIIQKPIQMIVCNWDQVSRKSNTTEARMKRKDGNEIEVELRLVPTTFEGEPAVQGVAIDITEGKRLREAAERMKRLASLGEISAQIAHEVRNALGSIQLNLRYLSDRLPEDNASKSGFVNIQAGIDRIQDTIRAILNFAKPDPPSFQRLNAFHLLEQILDSIELEMKAGNISIVRDYKSPLPDISIDVNQIRQAFLNLCLNARRAMPSGGTIFVRAKVQREHLVLEVEDTGPGITSEIAAKIFEPFFTTSPDGTGLGLSIVSRILEQHQAQILVNSGFGHGATFILKFPVDSQI